MSGLEGEEELDELDELLAVSGHDVDGLLADLASGSSSDDDTGSAHLGNVWLDDIALGDFPEFDGIGAPTQRTMMHSYEQPAPTSSSSSSGSDEEARLCSDKPAAQGVIREAAAAAAAAKSPLPAGWESKVTNYGRKFFINHATKSTTWVDPRTGLPSRKPKDGPPAGKKVKRVNTAGSVAALTWHGSAAVLPRAAAASREGGAFFLIEKEDAATVDEKREVRRAALERYRLKKRQRAEAPPKAAVKYKARKQIADARPRVKGRFVTGGVAARK